MPTPSFRSASPAAAHRQGQIIDGTTNGGSVEIAFIATHTQTLTLTPGQEYVYDVQVIDSNGQLYTLEIGTLCPQQGVTAATT